MNKKIIGITLATVAIAVFAGYGSGASAAFSRQQGQYGPNYTPERHEQMLKAFASNDHDAWKSLMGDRGAARVVTKENFARFTQMHNLMLEGKYDEANKIRAELGLGSGQGRGMMGAGGAAGAGCYSAR